MRQAAEQTTRVIEPNTGTMLQNSEIIKPLVNVIAVGIFGKVWRFFACGPHE